MTPEEHQRVGDLFLKVRRLPEAQRREFLVGSCAGDEALRRRVERMLSHDSALVVDLDTPLVSAGAVAEAFADAAPGAVPEWIAGFRVLGVLGSGGMGVVYRAAQASPEREVALKVLRPGWFSAGAARRLGWEAQVLARLEHPGIARVYEAGAAEGGAPYFAMELIAGRPLTAFADERALGRCERLELIAAVCDAVQHAHVKGVVHRDLKPMNILVADGGSGAPQPKVLDFGVAKVTDADVHATVRTRTGEIIGTLRYMSPEQVVGDPRAVDARADVYALGVITFELLTGALPHDLEGRTIGDCLRIIAEHEPRSLGSVDRRLRGDLDTVVRKALERDPARRYQAAGEFGADLRRVLRDEPISARPPGLWYSARTFARRNTGLVAAVATAFVALAAGLGVAVWQAGAAIEARDEARRQTRISGAVNAFLNDMLTAADPWRRGGAPAGADATILGALDGAAERVEHAFEGQPEVEAAVRTTIAETYKNLGRFDEASDHFDAALALRRSALGDDHPETIASERHCAEMLEILGEFGNAAAAHRGLLARATRVLGDDHPETLACTHGLATALRLLGELGEADRLSLVAVNGRRRVLGPDHERTVEALESRALTLTALERHEESAEALRRVLEARVRAVGEDHPATAEAMYELANALLHTGDLDEAAGLASDALRRMRAVVGDDHPQTAVCHVLVSRIARFSGDLSAAEAAGRRAIETYERVVGPDHAAVVSTRYELAQVLLGRKDYAGARAEFARVVDGRRGALGGGHPDTLTAMLRMADAAYFDGDAEAAAATYRRAHQDAQEALGAHALTAGALEGLIATLSQMSRFAELEPLLLRHIELCGQLGDPAQAALVRRRLGIVYRILDRYADAEPVLLTAHAELAGKFGEADPRTSSVAAELAKLYDEWSKEEQASEWRARAAPAETRDG